MKRRYSQINEARRLRALAEAVEAGRAPGALWQSTSKEIKSSFAELKARVDAQRAADGLYTISKNNEEN